MQGFSATNTSKFDAITISNIKDKVINKATLIFVHFLIYVSNDLQQKN